MMFDEDAARGRLDEGTEALTDAMSEIEDLQRQLAVLKDLSAVRDGAGWDNGGGMGWVATLLCFYQELTIVT
jgi:hypothetical protein